MTVESLFDMTLRTLIQTASKLAGEIGADAEVHISIEGVRKSIHSLVRRDIGPYPAAVVRHRPKRVVSRKTRETRAYRARLNKEGLCYSCREPLAGEKQQCRACKDMAKLKRSLSRETTPQ